ncbi:hypothetical protein JTE90_019834 [Oedothorax gibbosus]|uniref:Uncharacterized protein n=1 Tax=Oedothorax gibbosus TaxID=931172 RepID=A0AAV6V7L1_9ARAC|nr:hypothetical protein JTE90_019834 [Oedothorax gibbosus]
MLLEGSGRVVEMAMDLERPMDSRSSSPGDRSSSQHMGRQAMVPQPHSSLKFSIEKILSPDFGTRRESIEKEREPREKDSHSKELISTSKSSSVSNENAAPGGSSGEKGGMWPQSAIPAWLFCTRFSDRPSSAFNTPPYINPSITTKPIYDASETHAAGAPLSYRGMFQTDPVPGLCYKSVGGWAITKRCDNRCAESHQESLSLDLVGTFLSLGERGCWDECECGLCLLI